MGLFNKNKKQLSKAKTEAVWAEKAAETFEEMKSEFASFMKKGGIEYDDTFSCPYNESTISDLILQLKNNPDINRFNPIIDSNMDHFRSLFSMAFVAGNVIAHALNHNGVSDSLYDTVMKIYATTNCFILDEDFFGEYILKGDPESDEYTDSTEPYVFFKDALFKRSMVYFSKMKDANYSEDTTKLAVFAFVIGFSFSNTMLLEVMNKGTQAVANNMCLLDDLMNEESKAAELIRMQVYSNEDEHFRKISEAHWEICSSRNTKPIFKTPTYLNSIVCSVACILKINLDNYDLSQYKKLIEHCENAYCFYRLYFPSGMSGGCTLYAVAHSMKKDFGGITFDEGLEITRFFILSEYYLTSHNKELLLTDSTMFAHFMRCSNKDLYEARKINSQIAMKSLGF